MTYPYRNFTLRGRLPQRGVTLIELMIAMVLGLVLTAGVVQIFLGNRATYAFGEGLSRIQENARFALEHIADSARMSGYRGCLASVAVFNNLDGAANDFRDDLEGGIQGYDFNGTGTGASYAAGAVNPTPSGTAGSWSPSLPAELTAPARVIPGSDVLVVRSVSGASVPLVAPFSDATQLFAALPNDLLEGEILVATDCQRASIFQATDVTVNGSLVEVSHGDTGAYTPGNSAGSWGPQQSYGLGSEVARLETVAFYVGRGENNTSSLFQLRLQRIDDTTSRFEPEELVEGIDTMQVLYGVDTDGDRQVDTWQSAATVEAAGNWDAVLSVEIALLARATEEYGMETDSVGYNMAGMRYDPVDDRRLRQVFTTTVGLRNRLP